MSRYVSVEDIVTAYRETGSIWKAGKRVGLAGQTVHERLRAVGYPMAGRVWTQDERDELANLIHNRVPLGEIAERLGRSYAGVACKAGELNIRSTPQRRKKLPRGAGWDKASTNRHMKALAVYSGTITQYARANGLSLELFVQAVQKHCPERWHEYLEEHVNVPRRVCGYCETEFIPASGKQVYCTRICGSNARADRNYFGGKRRETVGLADQTCQLCGRTGVKGLSSHHMLGKENDPENEFLIALCPGCHKCVSLLATRLFVDDEEGWEHLISLVWLRRHGPEHAAGMLTERDVLHVTVDIDRYLDDPPDAVGDDHSAAAAAGDRQEARA